MKKYYCPRCGEEVEMKEDIFDKTVNFYCHKCKISGNIKAAKKEKFNQRGRNKNELFEN